MPSKKDAKAKDKDTKASSSSSSSGKKSDKAASSSSKDAGGANEKLKAANSVNVRHILVSFFYISHLLHVYNPTGRASYDSKRGCV